ncbi:gonad-stimulating substance-like isoform X2 [Amphiura filiformis]
MATLHKFIALTLGTLLILGATSSADSAKYCGLAFSRAVMETCARQVKRTAPLWERLYTASRVKRFSDPEFWNAVLESDSDISMDKRQPAGVGMATYCCNHGCTDTELSLVC